MTTTVTVNLTEEEPPPGAQLLEMSILWNPVPTDEPQKRTLNVRDISPANDRLASEMCGTGVMNALGQGAPMSLMVVWFVAGQQMRLKREPWRKLEHLFTVSAFDRAELEGVYELDDDESGLADVDTLDDIDLDGDGTDPTEAPTT